MRLNNLTKTELLEFCRDMRIEIIALRKKIRDISSLTKIGDIPNSVPKRQEEEITQ